MDKKINLPKLLLFTTAGIVIFIALVLAVLAIASRKPTAAFYGISERNQKNIVTVLQTTHKRRNKKSLPYNVVTLDSSVSLQKALKKVRKPTLLFINNGLNADYAASLAAKKGHGLEKSVLSGMTRSVVQTAIFSKGKVIAVPLLLDNYEIDISNLKFKPSDIESVNTLEDLEILAKKSKSSTMAPIIFDSSNDENFLNIFGAFVEAVSGREKYESAVEKIKQSIAVGKSSRQAFISLLTELSAVDGEFYETVNLFKKWVQMGILPKNYLKFHSKDVNAYMLGGNINAVVIMSLSAHRSTERAVISKYSSRFIPALTTREDRSFTAPVTYGIMLKKNKIAKHSLELLAGELQNQLSIKTGLAPVLAQCGVPDRQSDDVRYWVAATEKPSTPLSAAAFKNNPNREAFAEALRATLKN